MRVAGSCVVAIVIIAIIAICRLCAADLREVPHWKTVLSFRPPAVVQKRVRARGKDWAVHRLEDAVGDVNLDIYSVIVSKLPSKGGKVMEAAEIVEHVRRNLNDFVDQSVAKFQPFDEDERKLWESDDPTGAILLVDMEIFGVANPDSGCVVTTRRTRNEWIFSTIRSGSVLQAFGPPAVAHPVSGNRAFGVYKAQSGDFVFYNVAADRPTRSFDNVAEFLGVLPAQQKKLWKAFQEKVAVFINSNGGAAKPGRSDAVSYNWSEVMGSSSYDVSDQPKWE